MVSRIGKEPWDGLTQQADKVYQLGNSALREQRFWTGSDYERQVRLNVQPFALFATVNKNGIINK